jgi:tellurite resistance protein TehA-like permease
VIVLLKSALSLRKRNVEYAEFGIAAGTGVLSCVLSYLLDNGSMLILGGVIVLIITVVNYFQRNKTN